MALPLILLGASTALQAYSSYMQGEAARDDARAQAQNELLRSLETRSRLEQNLKLQEKKTQQIIGSQQVAYAASGVDVTSGAPLELYAQTMQSSIEDQLRMMREADFDNLQSQKSRSSMLARGESAYTAGILGAVGAVGQGAYSYSKAK